MTSFNWSDLQTAAAEAGFVLVPAGEYEAEIDEAEYGTTSTGKDRIRAKFKILNGPHAGARVTHDFVITKEGPKAQIALGFFFRYMAALGLGQDYFAAEPSLEAVALELTGRQALIKVDIDTSYFEDGKNVIKSIKRNGGAAPLPPPVSSGSTMHTPLPGLDEFAPAAAPAVQAPPASAPLPEPPPLPAAF